MTGYSDDLPNAAQFVQFIGLNPSTADETNNDPTVRRCIAFAKSWGYGSMCMTNIFAFRATDPEVMKSERFPFGDENSKHILSVGSEAALIIAAWGTHGAYLSHGNNVRKMFSHQGLQLHHLGLTRHGHPKHPLYLKATTQPTLWI